MFGSTVLEVAIGLVFVYWLLSLLCSAINEQVIVPLLNLRAKFLEEGIKNMLDDPQGDKLVNQLYETPLIKGLSRKASSDKPRKPSYIPADTFALALMSLDAFKAYKDNPSTENSFIPQALAPLIDKAKKDPASPGDPAIVLASIEKWYNDTMGRVSGWYKGRVQLIILLLALVIVVSLNIDTVSLISSLSNDTAMRSAIVSAAQGAANSQNNAKNLATIQQNIAQLQPVIGWSTLPADLRNWVLKVFGLLATIFAVSLGAPFWFDLLNKFTNFRSSGPPPQPNAGATGSTSTPPQLVVAVTGAPSQASTNGVGTVESTGTTIQNNP